ncbi:structural protein [Cellulophaga phage phi47:1]|uniref:hypothetical protein n=1 Tax=Cellulophaga phage phiSM TaxID=756280 RepID=UPI0002B78D68|nr:hypothetical protein CEPG_00006 [Cellulophaga phage phiSM]AGF91169.1 hypothetical protein CHPG_00017 [Cellulophaga phage phi3:1]AGF91663.1 hypothetical protein CDPG_00059 [Cellulophaga phage phi47:1]AGO47738.1 structural protein [Cellulophaga phage phi3ST:2]AGO49246.1 structural protein [Cellulophaga phage phi38:2]AGH07754.1 hypothetical protein CEPG_00006 [Cellulophaga phage phiSM]
MKRIATTNKNNIWYDYLIFKVGDAISHLSRDWINVSGSNSEPNNSSSDWVSTSQNSSSLKETIAATEDQTVIELTTDPDSVEVFINQAYQIEEIDYTYLDGTITMTNTLYEGDIINVRKF